MNIEIVPFVFEGSTIRTVTDNGVTFWCGRDVATALGYKEPNKAVRDHCKGGLKQTPLETPGGIQQVRFINEADLYRLIVSSKLPSARRFEAWVFEEVLPTIRRHGAYMTPQTLEKVLSDPDTVIRLATDLKRERERRRVLESKVEVDAPKVLFAESVASSESSILVGQLAKLITQNGYHIGQNRLFAWLRERGYLSRRRGADWNMPKQDYVEAGLFEIKESSHMQPDGSVRITRTPKVTGKGQIYFVDKFLGVDPLLGRGAGAA